MILQSEPSQPRAQPDGPPPGDARDSSAPPAAAALAETLASDLAQIFADVRRLLRIRWSRRRLALRRALEGSVRALLLAICAATLIVVACIRLVAGVSQGLAELFGGRLWLGNLLGGAVVLGLIALSMAWAQASRDRRELKKRSSEYGDLSEHDEPADGPSAAQAPEAAADGGGVPGAARSPRPAGNPADVQPSGN